MIRHPFTGTARVFEVRHRLPGRVVSFFHRAHAQPLFPSAVDNELDNLDDLDHDLSARVVGFSAARVPCDIYLQVYDTTLLFNLTFVSVPSVTLTAILSFVCCRNSTFELVQDRTLDYPKTKAELMRTQAGFNVRLRHGASYTN